MPVPGQVFHRRPGDVDLTTCSPVVKIKAGWEDWLKIEKRRWHKCCQARTQGKNPRTPTSHTFHAFEFKWVRRLSKLGHTGEVKWFFMTVHYRRIAKMKLSPQLTSQLLLAGRWRSGPLAGRWRSGPLVDCVSCLAGAGAVGHWLRHWLCTMQEIKSLTLFFVQMSHCVLVLTCALFFCVGRIANHCGACQFSC